MTCGFFKKEYSVPTDCCLAGYPQIRKCEGVDDPLYVRAVAFEEIEPFLQGVVAAEPDMYVALYADESVPYREIVRVLNIANKNQFKLVIATRPVRE